MTLYRILLFLILFISCKPQKENHFETSLDFTMFPLKIDTLFKDHIRSFINERDRNANFYTLFIEDRPQIINIYISESFSKLSNFRDPLGFFTIDSNIVLIFNDYDFLFKADSNIVKSNLNFLNNTTKPFDERIEVRNWKISYFKINNTMQIFKTGINNPIIRMSEPEDFLPPVKTQIRVDSSK